MESNFTYGEKESSRNFFVPIFCFVFICNCYQLFGIPFGGKTEDKFCIYINAEDTVFYYILMKLYLESISGWVKVL